MKIEMLTAVFYLEGCYSLKEKRRRLSGLRHRFGRQSNLAVCESDYQDDLNRSQWSFIAAASDGRIVDKTLSAVEIYLDEEVDAVLAGLEREEL